LPINGVNRQMLHVTLPKATVFVALACAWLATQQGFGQRQELTRIEPPAEEATLTHPGHTHNHHATERFAEYAPRDFDPANADPAQPPAPLDATEPEHGAGNYTLGKYGGHGCCGLTGFVGIESTFLFPALQDAPASVQIEENGGPDALYTTGEVELD